MKKKNILVQLLIMLALLLLLAGVGSFLQLTKNKVEEFTSAELYSSIETDKVKTLNLYPEAGIYVITGELKEEKKYKSSIPESQNKLNELIELTTKHKVEVSFEETPTQGFFSMLISRMLVWGLVIGLLYFVMKKVMGSKNGPMGIGESKAKMSTSSDFKFSDVIGYEEEKQELIEIVDFLKSPEKYDEMGAKVPNGVLLEGPAGTGKTLIAKALAGEVGVPYYSISGSDFVEMYVGVGASRVRSLFKEAKKQQRAIIFIDEIDAIGSRENDFGGRNSEQEQTINQLLVELDGFATSKGGIIIIAATNRADKLDPALLRSGRFDRKILVGLPELKDREEILKFHARNRHFKDTLDFKELARMTSGMSGAELEAVTNEACILVVRDKRDEVDFDDVTEAIDRVLMGPAKISNKYTDADKKLVSYHESGHAIIGLELENALKVQKITIIPRRNAGGYVSFMDDEEQTKMISKRQLEDRLVGMLGGRAAEEIFIGDITAGAYSDYKQATTIARLMVTEFGLSELGLYQYENSKQQYVKFYSDKTAKEIDAVVDKMLVSAHEKALEILKRRTEDMHLLAKTIGETETMTRLEIEYLLKNGSLDGFEKNKTSEKETNEL